METARVRLFTNRNRHFNYLMIGYIACRQWLSTRTQNHPVINIAVVFCCHRTFLTFLWWLGRARLNSQTTTGLTDVYPLSHSCLICGGFVSPWCEKPGPFFIWAHHYHPPVGTFLRSGSPRFPRRIWRPVSTVLSVGATPVNKKNSTLLSFNHQNVVNGRS